MTVGEETFVSRDTFVDNEAEGIIGSRCSSGSRVTIRTGTHRMGAARRRAGASVAGSVMIEDGIRVGARVTIRTGVTIGKGAHIAAGSVADQDCEANALFAEVPALRGRTLEPLETDPGLTA